jgi:hypothetical protein
VRKRKPSIKVGCKAKFFVRKSFNADTAEIEFHFKHTGHDVGTIAAMRESRMSRKAATWLQEKVNEGLDWKAINALFRSTNIELDAVSEIKFYSRCILC